MSDYWAAIAQVIPVVAFAIVLEARTISLSWHQTKVPKPLRVVQSLMWGSILIVFAFTETRALQAVRGSEPPGWLAPLTEFAIAGGMGILVFSPAIEVVVRANPEGWARILTVYPVARVRIWYLDRQILRYIRGIDWILTQNWADFGAARDVIAKSEGNLAEVEREFRTKREKFAPEARVAWEERISDTRQWLAKSKITWAEGRSRLHERFVEHERDKAASLRRRAQRPAQWREEIVKERVRLAAHLATFSAFALPSPPRGEHAVSREEMDESTAPT